MGARIFFELVVNAGIVNSNTMSVSRDVRAAFLGAVVYVRHRVFLCSVAFKIIHHLVAQKTQFHVEDHT